MDGHRSSHLKTIVIVDDDLNFVKELKDSLEQEGYTVYYGLDGSMAMDIVQKHHPDLILMDVNMPFVDGLKAFQNLRSNPKTNRIPVIFLTELGSGMIYPVVQSSPRAAHLKKPFDLPDLTSLCRQFLANYAA